MIQPLQVSLALITDAEQHVLITKRAQGTDMGGYWEFPGGKIEPEETPEDTLKRELVEELGIVIHSASFVTQMLHHYPSKTVLLHVYHVTKYSGLPHCCEQQEGMRWVSPEVLAEYQLLEAGVRLIPYLTSLLNIPHHV